MSNIVRAWKDESYRQGLSVEEQAALPANPAGEIDLSDEELEAVYGAWSGWFDQDDFFNPNRNRNSITNSNTNSATSSSTSSATGGSATATGGMISISI